MILKFLKRIKITGLETRKDNSLIYHEMGIFFLPKKNGRKYLIYNNICDINTKHRVDIGFFNLGILKLFIIAGLIYWLTFSDTIFLVVVGFVGCFLCNLACTAISNASAEDHGELIDDNKLK